jgi:uncharacterized membrane protein YfcA
VSPLEAVVVALAGVCAGAINTVVGSGTLVTFPVLLAVGYSPVVANVSNTIGLVPGSVTGAVGYRRELAGQRTRAIRLGAASFTGGVTGAIALLVLPEAYFEAIVPAFILVALVLIIFQKRLSARMAARREAAPPHGGPWTAVGVFLAGIYGGYFGAAQGILLISILGLTLPDNLQRINALKNVLAGLVNFVAGVVFILVADVAWEAAGLIAVGAIAGGVLGARYGRRLPDPVLRGFIVVVGVVAIVRLLTS